MTAPRILVAGTSGSGKSTLARRIAERTGAPYVEIDALFHGPGWQARPTFLDDVRDLAQRPAWVTEWQYPAARPILAAHADLLVWLDLPRRTVMRQVIGRTVRRSVRREPLWNGNVEPPLRTFWTDRDHIVRWAWRTHGEMPGRVAEAVADRPDLAVVRLGSHPEADRFLAALS